MVSPNQIIYKNFDISCVNMFGNYHIMFVITPFYKGKYALMMVSFTDLLKFLAKYDPEKATYINTIKKQISGYGSKENIILERLQQENFPLELCVIQYFKEHQKDVLEMIDLQSKNHILETSTEDAKKEVKETLKIWQEDHSSFNKGEFLDELEQTIVSYLIEVYPKEMNNFEPDDYQKLSTVLSCQVPQIGEIIINQS